MTTGEARNQLLGILYTVPADLERKWQKAFCEVLKIGGYWKCTGVKRLNREFVLDEDLKLDDLELVTLINALVQKTIYSLPRKAS